MSLILNLMVPSRTTSVVIDAYNPPDLVTRLGTHPGSLESCPRVSITETAGTHMVNSSPNIQALKASHPPERRHRPLQRQDKTTPSGTDSKNLSSQVKPAPHGIDSKNLLERHPPQRQVHSRSSQPPSMNRPSLVWAPFIVI
jgi:hypothetical protein